MAGLKLQAFAGIAPKKSAYLLQDTEAQIATNTKLYSGEIRSWRRPGPLTPPIIKTFIPISIYRMNNISGDSVWLSWATDVDVAPGPIYDSGSPIYYTGDGLPKKTNAVMAVATGSNFPADYLLMGVPTPTVAPTVSSTDGASAVGSTTETRTYLYTFISMFGAIAEESAPSPTSALVSVLPNGTVNLSGLPSAAPTGKYNITSVRVYRSVTGTSSTIFLKVADVPIGTTTLHDTVLPTSLGVSLPSTTWGPPPDGLTGLVSMANGIMAGFVGNQIYFCEPFKPHAWPAEYGLSVEFPVVGLAAYGSSLVVGTKGNPFIITGTNPAAMSQDKLPLYEPCMSKRSIASDEQGAMYASPNGIIKIGPSIADNVTRNLFTRDEWSRYTPSSMMGEVQDGRYFLFYRTGDLTGGLILDRNEAASPLTLVTTNATALHADPVNAKLYLAEDNEIKGWDSDRYNNLQYEWRSKIFVMPRPLNFGAVQVNGDFDATDAAAALEVKIGAIAAGNHTIFVSGKSLLGGLGSVELGDFALDGSLLSPIPVSVEERFILLTIYADGILRANIQIKSSKPVSLPSGFKADQWEFVVTGNVAIRFIKIAETSKELVSI